MLPWLRGTLKIPLLRDSGWHWNEVTWQRLVTWTGSMMRCIQCALLLCDLKWRVHGDFAYLFLVNTDVYNLITKCFDRLGTLRHQQWIVEGRANYEYFFYILILYSIFRSGKSFASSKRSVCSRGAARKMAHGKISALLALSFYFISLHCFLRVTFQLTERLKEHG